MLTAENTETPASDVFLTSLTEIESEIDRLRERYQQISTDDLAREELRLRRKVVKSRGRSTEAKQELQEITARLDQLDTALESQLMTMEPFWTAVRYGGLGLLIGWGIKTWLG
jgi:predicted RNase H-like nuclease (RuvC/YqgF family)